MNNWSNLFPNLFFYFQTHYHKQLVKTAFTEHTHHNEQLVKPALASQTHHKQQLAKPVFLLVDASPTNGGNITLTIVAAVRNVAISLVLSQENRTKTFIEKSLKTIMKGLPSI